MRKSSLRLMSWNLLEGAHRLTQNPQDPPSLDAPRMAAAQALVRALAPQVLVLNEALWCQPFEGYQSDYASLLGFAHAQGQLYDGCWGNVILSAWPLTVINTLTLYNRGGLVVRVDSPHGPLQVATYHPHPSRYPHHKADDFSRLVDAADPNLPLVVCGDFNAISPDDRPDRAKLAEAFSLFSEQPEVDSARFVDGGEAVFPALLQRGLRDAIPMDNRRASMPTRLISQETDGGMRIDHAWVNSHVAVLQGWVSRDPRVDLASDHYPVVVDLVQA